MGGKDCRLVPVCVASLHGCEQAASSLSPPLAVSTLWLPEPPHDSSSLKQGLKITFYDYVGTKTNIIFGPKSSSSSSDFKRN